MQIINKIELFLKTADSKVSFMKGGQKNKKERKKQTNKEK